jgi:hypothetical protein
MLALYFNLMVANLESHVRVNISCCLSCRLKGIVNSVVVFEPDA